MSYPQFPFIRQGNQMGFDAAAFVLGLLTALAPADRAALHGGAAVLLTLEVSHPVYVCGMKRRLL
jgi:hypothetical protein